MGRIYDAVNRFFEDEEWPVRPFDDEPAVEGQFEGDHGEFRVVALADELEQRFAFYAVCPEVCPPESRAPMAELLTRVNYGMMIGNFELDLDDGEIRYKGSLDVEGVDLPLAMLRSLVFSCCTTLDLYRPAIQAVLEGRASPREAVDLVELEDEPTDVKTGL